MTERDKQLEQLLTSIEVQKEEIKKLEKEIRGEGFLTNMRFRNFGDEVLNLNVVPNIELIRVLSTLEIYFDKFTEICKREAIEETFIWSSFPIEDWRHDIHLKIKKNQIVEKKQLLSNAEKIFKAKFSKDKKDEMEINNLKSQLGL